MANKYLKVFNIFSHQEMQIKTNLRRQLIPVRTNIKKTVTTNVVGTDVEKDESLFTAGGNVNVCSQYENQCGRFSKS